MSLNLAAFDQARWERNSYLAVACLIFYEYLIQLSNEVELFWKKRWSLGKGLFLWSRYYSLAYNISNAVVFMQPKPSYNMFVFCYLMAVQIQTKKAHYAGNTFFHWQNTGAALQTVTTHIILEVRLYAMYGNSRKILALLLVLLVSEATAIGIVFGIPNQKLIGTNEPFPELFICADGDPQDGSHWVAWYWAAILIIESSFLCLSLVKAWMHHKTGGGGGLMRNLTRDSVIYFVLIFGIYLGNLILWLFNRLTLNELGTGYSFVISSVLANRLLINVRLNYYHSERELESRNTAIHFADSATPSKRTERITADISEMETFDDRRGF